MKRVTLIEKVQATLVVCVILVAVVMLCIMFV